MGDLSHSTNTGAVQYIFIHLTSTKDVPIKYSIITYDHKSSLACILQVQPARALTILPWSTKCSLCPCIWCLWIVTHSLSFSDVSLLIFIISLYAFGKQQPVKRETHAHGREAEWSGAEQVAGCSAGPSQYAWATQKPSRRWELYPYLIL